MAKAPERHDQQTDLYSGDTGSTLNLSELEICQVNDARHRYLFAKRCVCVQEGLYEITVTERDSLALIAPS